MSDFVLLILSLYLLMGIGSAVAHLLNCRECLSIFSQVMRFSLEFITNMMTWPMTAIEEFKNPQSFKEELVASAETVKGVMTWTMRKGETLEQFKARVAADIKKINQSQSNV